MTAREAEGRKSSPGRPATDLAAGARPLCRVEGSGPLMIYVPGLDGTGHLFFKQLTGLARHYRVATYRMRDEGRFTYEDLADDIAAIVDDFGEEKATLVGESFGGTLALLFALRHAERVERLVIVNSFARFRGRVRIALAAKLAAAIPFSLVWLARLAADSIGLLADGVRGADRARVLDALGKVRRDGYVRRLQLISEVDIEERLAEIAAPTLLLAGKRDLLLRSAEEAEIMARKLPNADLRLIPGAGHACLLGDRVRLAEILSDWTAGRAAGEFAKRQVADDRAPPAAGGTEDRPRATDA